jgi:(p)ppGpp synthase/HD superfamily hydrolase
MAMTLMIENINHDISSFPPEKSEATIGGSYYKFYQLKLRQLVTQTRYRKEQEARIARQKQSKNQPIDNRLSEQRLHKEYMNYVRDRAKNPTQEIVTNKNDEQKRRSESVLSYSNRTITLSVTPTNISTPIESRPKVIVKPKQTPT